jgi:hypothetical protein
MKSFRMLQPLAYSLALSVCLVTGCVLPEDGSDFGRGGERAPEPEALPAWGDDNCGVPGAPGSPWSGQVTLDWRLEDPFGRSVHLHQFCGRVVLIESMQSESPDFEARLIGLRQLRAEFNPWELAVVVLVTGPEGDEPDSDLLAELTLGLDLNFPLLSDPEWRVGDRYSDPVSSGRSIHLYRPGLVLEATGLSDVDESDVEALLPQGGLS